jgi:transposase
MENQIHIPLDLPDVRILEVNQLSPQGWLIRVESTLKGSTCAKCGRETDAFHGYDAPIRLRHLPLFEVPVWIEIRPKRYRCPHCEGNPTSTQSTTWYQRRSPNTKAYEQWLLRILVNSTVRDVSRKLNLSEASVNGVLDRWIETRVNWAKIHQISVLGIDEIALKRGHRDYVVIVTSKTSTGVSVLGVLPDRKRETVEQFLASIPPRLQATIERVCSDMYSGYINAVRAQLPEATVIVDRFHVAQNYRDCADTVRKQELKRLKQELPKAEYALFKGTMWAFRKPYETLQWEEKVKLNRLFVYSPAIEQAYTLSQQLTEIFEANHTKETGTRAILAWANRVRQRQVKAFDSFLTTLDHWLNEITNYFIERQTSGFVEGFNNRIKVLKRRCFGIFDVNRLFQRLTLDLQGYTRFPAISIT